MFLILVPIYLAATAIVGAVMMSSAGGWGVMIAGTGLRMYYGDKYPRGEGPLTPRCNGGEGILISAGDTDRLGGKLGVLSRISKSLVPFLGRRYLLTVSEGEFLEQMIAPAMTSARKWLETLNSVTEDGGSASDSPALKALHAEIEAELVPVVEWLGKLHESRWRSESN